MYTYIYIYIHIYTCISMYTYASLHIYTHTHTHTHINIQTQYAYTHVDITHICSCTFRHTPGIQRIHQTASTSIQSTEWHKVTRRGTRPPTVAHPRLRRVSPHGGRYQSVILKSHGILFYMANLVVDRCFWEFLVSRRGIKVWCRIIRYVCHTWVFVVSHVWMGHVTCFT